MKPLNPILFLLLFLCLLAHPSRAQQLPSQRSKDAMLSSRTQQKLLEMQAQRPSTTSPVPGQEQQLPSRTVDVNKYKALLPPHSGTTPDGERSKKLPSNNRKIQPPARRPKVSH